MITRASAVIRGSDEAEWLRRCGTLTAVRADERNGHESASPEALAARLVALARLVAASPPSTDHGCALGPTPEARRACELAAELAAQAPLGPQADVPPEGLASAYLAALQDAAQAVYLCRRLEHASGHCWFDASGPQRDLCGHVLVAAHALRSGVPGSPAR